MHQYKYCCRLLKQNRRKAMLPTVSFFTDTPSELSGFWRILNPPSRRFERQIVQLIDLRNGKTYQKVFEKTLHKTTSPKK